MGLFGMFEKKNCDICGGDIGLLGNRKLADGNLCKTCAAKLSPFFDERKTSTVAQIREQLNYREENQEAVKNFNITSTIGRHTKLYLDENARKFLVTSANSLQNVNPDVLDFSQVAGVDFDIQESRSEEKRTLKNPDGTTKQISFVPPHYKYNYTFKIRIAVNHPYFNEIDYNLNQSSVTVETLGPMNTKVKDPRMMNNDYVEYLNMGNEIVSALTQVREDIRTAAAEAAKPQEAVTCPNCGATTFPDKNGRCEYCRGAI